MSRPTTVDDIWTVLSRVLDPCSIHNGTRLSFVDLGMVHSVELEEHGHACVRLLLDDPICLYLVDIMTSVRDAALSVYGVESVDVEIVGDEIWSPDRLTPETNRKMQRWQAARESRRLPSRSPLPSAPAQTPVSLATPTVRTS